jgi:hypothetical protein
MLAKKNPNWIESSIPGSVYYYNYHVGECKDLIFGVGLTDYATSKGLPEGEIPRIVQLCIEEVERRGLDSEGIYRVRQSFPESTYFIPKLTRILS